MEAHYRCRGCQTEFHAAPGSVSCPRCGHGYVDWLNSHLWANVGRLELKRNALKRLAAASCLLIVMVGAAKAQLGSCATVQGPLLPDLIIAKQDLSQTIFSSFEHFGNVCNYCVDTIPSDHEVIRFTSSTWNVGKTDLVVGDPSQCPNLFFQSACASDGYKLRASASYRLWTPKGWQSWVQARDMNLPIDENRDCATAQCNANEQFLFNAKASGALLVGRKDQYCFIDDEAVTAAGRKSTTAPQYLSCSNQGLSVGWADYYNYFLNCQLVVVDNVPAGRLVMEIHTNPAHLLPESDYTNNSTGVVFQFTPCGHLRFAPSDPC